MECISMDLLGQYSEMTWGHCSALTVICMLTSFVEVIPIEDKKTETFIKAYTKYVYSDNGGSKRHLFTNPAQSPSTQDMIHGRQWM